MLALQQKNQEHEHDTHHEHNATYERMKTHTKSWYSLYLFLQNSNWNQGDQNVHQIAHPLLFLPLWNRAKGLHYHLQGQESGLKSIMKRVDNPKAAGLKRKSQTHTLKEFQAKTIADHSCAGSFTKGYYTYTGNTGSHDLGLYVEPLGPGVDGEGHVVAIFLTSHPFTHTASTAEDLQPHMVILFDTHLLVFVVLRHVPATNGHTHHQDDMKVFFPDLTVHHRILEDGKWILNKSST